MMKYKQTRSDVAFDIINYSLLSILLIIMIYPLIYIISASVSDPMLVLNGKMWLLPKGLNFEAYIKVFNNQDILLGYKNTILYTVVGTAVSVILTVAGAYPLSRKNFYGRNFFTLLLAFTMVFQGGLIPTYLVIKNLNLINNFWVMILPSAIQMWNLIVMRTFFQNNIPEELNEAAIIDGASNLKTLVKIVLPLSKAILAIMILFYGVFYWNQYFNALIYLSDEKKYPLQVFLREILIQSDLNSMMDQGGSETMAEQLMLAEGIKYAVIIVSSLPVLMIYPFIQKYFVRGVMIGAIKG